MKKIVMCAHIFCCLIILSASNAATQIKANIIDSVKPTSSDIPEGFVYGKVPGVYKKTLRENPWMMDGAAIKRLAGKVYPGGDHNKIISMHVSIIAKKDKPFGDDMVCYLILYKDAKAAREEIKKVAEFSGYNSDRCILLTKENFAAFLFVDDISNFHYIRDLAATLEKRIKNF